MSASALAVLSGALLVEARLRLPDALHPVAWFGRAASALIAHAPREPRVRALLAGTGIALGLPLLVYVFVAWLLRAAEPWPLARALLQAIGIYASVALFGLLDAARAVQRALEAGALGSARARLSSLCSRDPSALEEPGLANGAIESLAENLSDAVVAPLCALALFGVEGALAYRAINTLDAMIGYRGELEWLGKPAARLDDLANLIPARLTALLLWLAALPLCALDSHISLARGLRTWWRDRGATPSPNGGHPMAMAAGLLGVRLDKPPLYVLGAALARPAGADIGRAIELVRAAGWIAFAFALAAVASTGLGGAYGAR